MNSFQEYRYVDIHCAVKDKHQKWQRVDVGKVEGIVKMIGNRADHIYTTVQRFLNPAVIDNEPELCPLPFDFDCATNINKAKEDCKRLVEYFIYNYNLDISPEEMMIYYSGNRGFHVTINYELFGASPMLDMIKVWRLVAEQIIKELHLETADRAIYTRRRAWRIPNTKHGKTGLYKIPLTAAQLDGSVENIKEAAKEPTKFLDLLEVI